jgi:hypothetical protein
MKRKKVINRTRANSTETAVQKKIANPVCEPVVPDALKTATPSAESAAEFVPESGPTVEQEEKAKAARRGKAGRARNVKANGRRRGERDYVPPSQPLEETPRKG